MLSLFPSLDLPPDARRTFRFHMAYALLDAACGGILLNAPFVALREIGAENWQLALRDWSVGFGMLASLYLGSWMATRRKMPFVFVPGTLAALCAVGTVAALAANTPFWFMMSLGIGGMFEIVTRPAIATILRFNYPVAARGQITSTVRQWSSLSFMVTLMLSAYWLRCADDRATEVAGIEIIIAATLGLTGFLCFRRIVVHEEDRHTQANLRLNIVQNVRAAAAIVLLDGRYRRYLFGCFVEGFFTALYIPFIYAFLSRTLDFGYIECAALTHGIPTLTAFLTTALVGRWFDRTNPWLSWACIRFAFGIDALLLAAAPLAALVSPAMILVLPVLGRILRGSVQGGWFVLWWQIGITHFAPPGEDTSRYAGIMVFLNGIIKIAAATAGIGLTAMSVQPVTLLWIGGTGVIASGFYSLWQAHRERSEQRPETFTEFEAQFAKQKP